jgi:hypothetical protein
LRLQSHYRAIIGYSHSGFCSLLQTHPFGIIREFPTLGRCRQAVFDRIGMHINAQVQQAVVLLNGFAMEQCTDPPEALVDGLGAGN